MGKVTSFTYLTACSMASYFLVEPNRVNLNFGVSGISFRGAWLSANSLMWLLMVFLERIIFAKLKLYQNVRKRLICKWKWKSIVNSMRRTVRSWPNPVILFNIHIFSLPFQNHIVCARWRSLLNYPFFVLSCISESGIWTKPMKHTLRFLLSLCLLSCSNSIESGAICRNRSMCPWSWLNWSPLQHFSWFFFMFINPKFVIGFIHFEMRDI